MEDRDMNVNEEELKAVLDQLFDQIVEDDARAQAADSSETEDTDIVPAEDEESAQPDGA